MSDKKMRIATRESPLALWQANFIRGQLLVHWPDLDIELLPMTTTGDKFLKDKLLTIGGKGLFVKELEEALLDGRADIAVHSMKDVPVVCPEGLLLPVICLRDNPLDAFVSNDYKKVAELPLGAVVGTSSLRRQSQLLALQPSLSIQPLRGNIHTRLQKMDDGGYDAIILATAGLQRMKMSSRICEILSPDIMLPACGQGALGIECRTGDEWVQQLIQPLHDADTALCVNTERRVNALLGGNCHTPLAVYCQLLDQKTLVLCSKVTSEDGQQVVDDRRQGALQNAMQLAELAVQALLARGAKKLLDRAFL